MGYRSRRSRVIEGGGDLPCRSPAREIAAGCMHFPVPVPARCREPGNGNWEVGALAPEVLAQHFIRNRVSFRLVPVIKEDAAAAAHAIRHQ